MNLATFENRYVSSYLGPRINQIFQLSRIKGFSRMRKFCCLSWDFHEKYIALCITDLEEKNIWLEFQISISSQFIDNALQKCSFFELFFLTLRWTDFNIFTNIIDFNRIYLWFKISEFLLGPYAGQSLGGGFNE